MKEILYECDRKACTDCHQECEHTKNIDHAKNFREIDERYIFEMTKNMAMKMKSMKTTTQWIPCSERLPDEGRFYFVTVEMWNKAYGTEYYLFEDGKWYLVADGSPDENTTWKEEIKSVIAWQPLPPRYEPKEDEG